MGFARAKAPLALSEARDGSLAEINRPPRETGRDRVRNWAAIWAAILVFFALMTLTFSEIVALVFVGGAALATGVALWAHWVWGRRWSR